MDSIPEELLADASNQQLAFDNQAYLGLTFHAQDSGLDSAPSSFDDEAPAYENIEKYENIDPPLNYQNLDFSSQQNQLAEETSAEEYENLKFEEEEELLFQSTYQNVDFANQPFKATPVYATLKKAPLGAPIAKAEGEDEEEEGPVYENYDFQASKILIQNGTWIMERFLGGSYLPKCGSECKRQVGASYQLRREKI